MSRRGWTTISQTRQQKVEALQKAVRVDSKQESLDNEWERLDNEQRD
jgi:hypothetical protein